VLGRHALGERLRWLVEAEAGMQGVEREVAGRVWPLLVRGEKLERGWKQARPEQECSWCRPAQRVLWACRPLRRCLDGRLGRMKSPAIGIRPRQDTKEGKRTTGVGAVIRTGFSLWTEYLEPLESATRLRMKAGSKSLCGKLSMQ
jgi:hypothetical protein